MFVTLTAKRIVASAVLSAFSALPALFRKIALTLGVVSILAFEVAAPAVADDPALGVKLESGIQSYSQTTSSNMLMVSAALGSFTANFVTSYLSITPLALDLSSINVSAGGVGTLKIIASATGLEGPLGLVGFISQLSGNVLFGNLASAILDIYISQENEMFDQQTLVSSIQASSGTPFAASGSGTVTTSGPYAVTEVVTIKTAGPTVTSLDASVTSAPEIDASAGASAIALLIGVLALMYDRRRQPAEAI